MNETKLWYLGSALFVVLCYVIYMIYLLRSTDRDDKHLNDWLNKH